MVNRMFTLLEDGAMDIQGMTNSADEATPEVIDALAKCFKDKHGKDSVGVKSLGDSKDLEHMGALGIVVNEGMLGMLTEAGLGGEKIINEMKEEVLERLSWKDLTPEQASVLEKAVGLLEGAEPDATHLMGRIDICKFRSDTLYGQWASNDSGPATLRISITQLEAVEKCLQTLIHEFSHDYGNDSDKSHVARIESIWMHVVARLVS